MNPLYFSMSFDLKNEIILVIQIETWLGNEYFINDACTPEGVKPVNACHIK